MTVSSTTNKVIYNCNGVTSVFAYTFRILDDDDILVQIRNSTTGTLTTLVKTTDYTVSGVDSSAGGNITLLDPATDAPTGYTIILTRQVSATQETDYNEYDTFPASSHERALDKLTMLTQQESEIVDRSIKLDAGVTGVSTTIVGTPTANQIQMVNPTATGFIWANLSAIAAYNFPVGTGILVQSVSGSTAIVRTLTGTANEVTVANGNGLSGDPTIRLATALDFTGKTVTNGTFSGIALTGGGSLTGTFTGAPTFSGALTLSGNFLVTGSPVFNNGSFFMKGGSSNTLQLLLGTTYTANRTFTFTGADANLILTMGGNLTVTNTSTVNGTFSGSSSGTNTGDETLSRVQSLVTGITQQRFTSGSGTYTTPANVKSIRIRMVAGGGGGGGSCTNAGNNGGTGGTGGSTTFGSSLLTCTGGTGGAGTSGANGGTGGTATINSPAFGTGLPGGTGDSVCETSTANVFMRGGTGGSSFFGGNGGGGPTLAAGKAGVTNTGGGGGGGGNPSLGISAAGGGGGSYIEAIINSPSSTYSYAVGAAGTAGTAGTGGFAGGAGGSGYIEVTEYYI